MESQVRENAIKRGYLKGDFEFFHIRDRKNIQFEHHYHDFNKIIIFISGSVTYNIEGRAYRLKPWDILLISSGEVHLPIVDDGSDYERIVLWLDQGFLDNHNIDDCDLSSCFFIAASEGKNLMRLNAEFLGEVKKTLILLEDSCKTAGFGSRILKNSLFLQLIVQLNRLYLSPEAAVADAAPQVDATIESVIRYIKDNIDEDLSIDALSARFYLSRYYLMHKFKQQTGYTIHSYIMNKRIIKAASLLRNGMQAYEICFQTGFGDYSSFVRAFKKNTGMSPKQYQKSYYNSPGSEAFKSGCLD